MQKIFPTFLLVLGLHQSLATADADPPPINPAELARQVHQQINRERQRHGLAPLAHDEHLAEIARNHSRDMAQHHFFNHVNPQGESPPDRAKRQGWHRQKALNPPPLATGIAENIFQASLYDRIYTTQRNGVTVKKEYAWFTPNQLVQTIVQGWMNSPHHRGVMLSPQYDRHGIGVAISGYTLYVTEDLF